MKAKLLLLSLFFIISGFNVEAQILKKLKKKVEKTTEKVLLKKTEQKTEQVVGNTIDSAVNPNQQKSNPEAVSSSNDAKLINTEAKRSFYTSDVVVTTSDSNGKGSDYYFDSDELAVRGMAPNSKNPLYIDSEAYQYGYNDKEGRWEKSSLMASDAMSFMMPMMSLGILKLPTEPTLEASEKLKNQGLNMNTFQIVEWAFIYKPEHFRTNEYTETTGTCPEGGSCPKFLYKDPEYKGSWVMFDKQGRLSEIYANIDTEQTKGDGIYKFEYTPVTVQIPSAVEVKMPFQDLYMKGLDVDFNRSGTNKEVSGNSQKITRPNTKPPSDPNDKIATIDPNNPLSFPGITSVLQAQGKTVTLELNTETMAMKVDLHDPKAKPIYFDKDNFIYMESGNGCIKAKLDLNKAFSQMEEGLKGKTLPSGMDIEKIKADYYRDNFGMQLSPDHVPPIAGWAYVYKPEFFENEDRFEKSSVSCEGSSCLKFTLTEGKEKGSYVLFDKYNRLKEISSTEGKGGTATYSYPSNTNIRIPNFTNCQEIDINEDVIGNMMGGY